MSATPDMDTPLGDALDAPAPPPAARRVPRFLRQLSWPSLLVSLLALVCFVQTMRGPIANAYGTSNLYSFQARALLHGHLDVEDAYFDTAPFNGKNYVPFPPMPAILLMPIVATLGIEHVNGPLLATLFTLLDLFVACRLARRLGLTPSDRLWFTLAMFVGTGYWYVVTECRGVWFLAHVVAVTGLLLAVTEAWGRGRGALVGLCLSVAFLSRQTTIFAGLALGWRLWSHPRLASRRERLINFAAFAATAGLGLGGYLAFNYARFGNPFDTGYIHIPFGGFLGDRFHQYGLFSLAHVPFNFMYLMLQGFHVDFGAPGTLAGGAVPDAFGTSLPAASPFLLAALFAGRGSGNVRALWLSVALIAFAHLTYLNNGFAQINTQRFSLDFLPLLFVLFAVGLRREAMRNRAPLWRGCICYAFALNALCLLLLPLLKK